MKRIPVKIAKNQLFSKYIIEKELLCDLWLIFSFGLRRQKCVVDF